jgi:DNA repair protein RecO
MIRKDEGVVLKTARSGETSKTATFLSHESGKIRLLAKGALGAKSPLRGVLEPGNYLEIVYYHREGRTLYYLREAHVRSTLDVGRDSLPRLSCALAALELADAVCHWESPDRAVAEELVEFIECPPAEDPVLLFLAFEFKLLSVLGALPDLAACAVCGGTLETGFFHPAEGVGACPVHSEISSRRIRLDAELIGLAETFAGVSLADLSRLTTAADTRKRLGAVLHWTYTFHVNNYRLPESLKLIPRD